MNFKIMPAQMSKLFFMIIMSQVMMKADGSFTVINNSLYQIKFIATVTNSKTNSNITLYTQALIPSTPTNVDGTLQIHPTDSNYSANSNVPVGTVAHIAFQGSAQDFNIQILNAQGTVIKQINVGTALGPVIDNDPSRVVYVYNNIDTNGKAVANAGGSLYFWDVNHSLQQPWVSNF